MRTITHDPEDEQQERYRFRMAVAALALGCDFHPAVAVQELCRVAIMIARKDGHPAPVAAVYAQAVMAELALGAKVVQP